MRRALIAVVLLALLAGSGAFLALRTYDAPGPLAEDRAVVVPRGGIDELAEALQREGVVAGALQVKVAALLARVRSFSTPTATRLVPSPPASSPPRWATPSLWAT